MGTFETAETKETGRYFPNISTLQASTVSREVYIPETATSDNAL